ncbi:MAG: flagellar biosynthetic protein FliP [Candidatus Hydrogenedentota bacterium]
MRWNRLQRLAAIIFLFCSVGVAFAQEGAEAEPDGLTSFVQSAGEAISPDRIGTTMTVFILLTVLSIAPAMLVMTTSFVRIIVVLGFLRQAMATQQSPPNQVLVGLALFLTFFIMMPTYQRVYDEGLRPYMDGEIDSTQEAFNRGMAPLREFMFRQVQKSSKGDTDVALFLRIGGYPRPQSLDDIPTQVLIPAFMLNEMRVAFMIGFLIYIPFLIIDMVVASTLMAMGMMMLPPVFVSLPFKIIMFVLADGWFLLISGLVEGFR